MRNIGANVKIEEAFPTADIGATDCWAGVAASGWISMQLFDQMMAIVTVGATYTDSITTLKLQQASDATGTGVKDITGKSITIAATTAADIYTLECRSDELDTNNDFKFVRVLVADTANTGADLVSGIYARAAARNAVENLAGADDYVVA